MNKRNSNYNYHEHQILQSLAPNSCFYDNTGIKESNHDQLYHNGNHEQSYHQCSHDNMSSFNGLRPEESREQFVRESDRRVRERRRELMKYEELYKIIDKLEAKERRSREVLIDNKIRDKLKRSYKRKELPRKTGNTLIIFTKRELTKQRNNICILLQCI